MRRAPAGAHQISSSHCCRRGLLSPDARDGHRVLTSRAEPGTHHAPPALSHSIPTCSGTLARLPRHNTNPPNPLIPRFSTGKPWGHTSTTPLLASTSYRCNPATLPFYF